jgi:hypothetical protein
MMKRFTTGSVAIVLFVGLTGSVLAQRGGGQYRPDDRAGQYGGSLDPRQHGYEHGYRDGADRGRQDRDRRLAYSLRPNDYQNSARAYEPYLGDRAQYIAGVRDGYKAGYDDGYKGRVGQYGQIYGRPEGAVPAPPPNDPYAARSWGSHDMAYDTGYRDGVTAGQRDQGRYARSNYRDSDLYRNADLGYQPSFGDKNAYRLKFQDGFERGYQDGYGQSRSMTDRTGSYLPDPRSAGVVGTRGQVGTSGQLQAASRTITVPGNRQWTATNIRVNEGDVIRFQTTGEIRFSANAADNASSAGSLAQKYVSGAPLPRALAGALIGRIDNGAPFGIGNQTSLTMPATGTLYLGVNDDNVSDNSGQFQVVMSR